MTNPKQDPNFVEDEEFREARPYGGDVGGDSVSRDEIIYMNMKRTYDAYQDLDLAKARTAADLDAERARSNNAAHDLVVMAAAQATAALFQGVTQAVVAGAQGVASHAKDQDQVAVRVAHNGAGNDKAFDEQGVFDARARSAAVWGTGTTPPTMAASGQAADDIGEGDERE